MTSRVDRGGSFASEVSAAIGGALPEVWTPGENEEPFDAHESHAMVIAVDSRGRERVDLPMVCAKCSLLDTSPQITAHCPARQIGSMREEYSVPEILDAIETAALALLCKHAPDTKWGPEAFEAVAYAALDGLRAARKQGAPPTPEAVSAIVDAESIAPRAPKVPKKRVARARRAPHRSRVPAIGATGIAEHSARTSTSTSTRA